MLIIADIDGTIADDRHRKKYLPDNMTRFYQLTNADPINVPGIELMNAIIASDENQEPLIVFLTGRPAKYKNEEGKSINVAIKTRGWLEAKNIKYDQLYSKDPFKDHVEGKISKFVSLVLEHMDERTIYYLEDDPIIAHEAKKRCPMTHVFLVTYEGYHEIH